MRVLVCKFQGTDAAVSELERFLEEKGHRVVLAETSQEAVITARTGGLGIALMLSSGDPGVEILELTQKLSMLGVFSVLLNGDHAAYNASEDQTLAQALAKLASHGSARNGNGSDH